MYFHVGKRRAGGEKPSINVAFPVPAALLCFLGPFALHPPVSESEGRTVELVLVRLLIGKKGELGAEA